MKYVAFWDQKYLFGQHCPDLNLHVDVDPDPDPALDWHQNYADSHADPNPSFKHDTK